MYNEIEKEFIPASNDWIFKTLYTLNPELLAAVITELELWAKFLGAKSKEELDMIEKANNPTINDAVRKLRDYNDDERARELAFKRARAVTDYNHRYEKGIEKGRFDEKISNIISSYNAGVEVDLLAQIYKMSVDNINNIINGSKEAKNND